VSIGQRIAGIAYCFKALTSNILQSLGWVLTTLCLLSDGPLLSHSTSAGLKNVVLSFLLFGISTRTNQLVVAQQYGYCASIRNDDGVIWIAPTVAIAIIREFLPASFGGRKLGFSVTGSALTRPSIKERNAVTRPCWWRRVLALHQSHGILYHTGFFMLITGLVCLRTYSLLLLPLSKIGSFPIPLFSFSRLQYCLAGPLFPGLGLERLPSFLTPLFYALFPPTDPKRRSLMTQDPNSGVWRPKQNSRQVKWSSRIWRLVLPHCALTAWVIWAWAY
jgi:hypothetical protein